MKNKESPPTNLKEGYKPPAHVTFKQQQKEVSMVRPLFLAGLMLLAVALLSPAMQMLREKEQRGIYVDDVNEVEWDPPPELPEPLQLPKSFAIPDLPDPIGGERRSLTDAEFRLRTNEWFGEMQLMGDAQEISILLREGMPPMTPAPDLDLDLDEDLDEDALNPEPDPETME